MRPEYNVAHAIELFLSEAPRHGLDLTTAAIVGAAEARNIPWFRVEYGRGMVQLGYGRFGHRLYQNLWDDESLISTSIIASDKAMTNQILSSLGLPVTRQTVVTKLEHAKRAAAGLGFPVVVKPRSGSKGTDVYVGLGDEAAVEHAFNQVSKTGQESIVEQYVPGYDHRMLVVGGKLIAAARRIPGSITGDGQHTVEELVDKTNADPRRGIGFENVLVKLTLDDAATKLLTDRGYTKDSIPKKGEQVFLRHTANISTGGTALDVSEQVHPDNRHMAELAAEAVGLEVVGVDFITRDIAQSHLEIGGAICEVNKSPGLRPHWVAAGGEQRDTVGPILDLKFPSEETHQIPIAAITGTNGKTTTSHMLAHIIETAGKCVGLVSTIGVSVAGRWVVKGDLAGTSGFHMAAHNPRTETVVAEVARGGLIKRGLGFRTCDVAAVTNVTADHLGDLGIESIADMARVKRIVAEAATGTLVLNADDPLCLAMRETAVADHIYLVTMESDTTAVVTHAAAGGRSARLVKEKDAELLMLDDDGGPTILMNVADVPATFGGAARHNVQNALFAAALARGMGVEIEHIRAALADFQCTYENIPARTNVYDGHPFRVILDYGHNPGGYREAGRMVTTMAKGRGRRICVITSQTNRNDALLCEIVNAIAPNFDHFICRESVLLDRKQGDILKKLRDALIANGIAENQISVIPELEKAMLAGLGMAAPGDILYISMSSIRPDKRYWRLIENFGKDSSVSEGIAAN